VIKVKEKLHLKPGRPMNGPGPLGVKVWATIPGKEPWPTEDKENIEDSY
jgi:hypothetical protein